MLVPRLQLICDDVRIENNGKLLIIGLYLDTIVVTELPIVLQPLTFFHVYEANETGKFAVTVELFAPEGKVGDPVRVDLDVKSPGVVAGIVKMNVPVRSAGKYRIVTSGDRSVVIFEQHFNVAVNFPAGQL